MSTETRRLVRTDSSGRPPRLSHSSWTMTVTLTWYACKYKVHKLHQRCLLKKCIFPPKVLLYQSPYMSSITQGRTSLNEHSYPFKPQQWLQKQARLLVNMDLFVSPWTWWICWVPGTVECMMKTCQRLMSLPDKKITSCVNSCLYLWQLPWGLEGGNSLPNDGTIPLHFVPPPPSTSTLWLTAVLHTPPHASQGPPVSRMRQQNIIAHSVFEILDV